MAKSSRVAPMRKQVLALLLLLAASVLAPCYAQQTPITRSSRLLGNINFVVTGGSLRTQPDTSNSCAVGATSTQNLSGVPAGTTVIAAYLYWGGSATTTGSTINVDTTVTFRGATVNANRTFTAGYNNGGTLLPFFGAVADVTALVTGNGSYTFGGLTVNTGAPHCSVAAVAAGWGLVVIYQGASERLRAINIFDGLQYFRGSAVTLTPDGFRVPTSNIDGRVAVITWEGDPANSGTLNGFSERLSYNGTTLDDGLVPAGSSPAVQQFDGTVNTQGVMTSYGADVDNYDISGLLLPGQTSGTTVYSAGGDLVLLTAQIVSVTSERFIDLAIAKTAATPFSVGANAAYTLTVSNQLNVFSDPEINTIQVSDTLPNGLTYVSATGTGWACAAAGQVVSCSHPPPLNPGQSLPPITLAVAVGAAAWPSVTNTATVSSASFDAIPANNTATVVTALSGSPPLPQLAVQKISDVLLDPVNGATNPKRIPGATVRYEVMVRNSGVGMSDNGSVVLTDPIPANTALYVSTASGNPVEFVDGSPVSGLSFNYATHVSYSSQAGGGPPFTYTPVPDASGFDPVVTGLRVAPSGVLLPNSVAGAPSFSIRFRVRLN
jgi:uncharacterized repeat protein (TIGR01451 family)